MNTRILIDLERLKYPYCGLGQFALNLGRKLLETRPETWDYVFLLPPDQRQRFDGQFEIEPPTLMRRFFPDAGPRFDLWHITHQGSRYGPPAGTPYLLTIHDLHFLQEKSPAKSRRRLKTLQGSVDGAAGISFASDSTRSLVMDCLSIPEIPARVIYHGFEPADFVESRRPDFLPDGRFLFAIGVIRPTKNFHVLVEFLSRLEQVSLVIAGTWADTAYVGAIRELAARHGVADRLILPGAVADEQRNWLYENCTAVFIPSLLEGFGLPLVEAMSFGKPVFSSTHGSLPEIGGDDVFYFSSFDPAAMEELYRSSIARFHETPGSSDRLRDRARSFSWTGAIEAYTAFYKEILGEQ